MPLHLWIEAILRILELDNLWVAWSTRPWVPSGHVAVTAHVLCVRDRVERCSSVAKCIVRLAGH